MKILPGIQNFLLFLLILFLFSSLATPAFAAVNYPYINLRLRYPAINDPYVGYGTLHSCVAAGLSTVLWNPAGLTRIDTGEALVILNQKQQSHACNYTTQIEEREIETGGENTGYSVYLYLRHTDLNTLTTQDVISNLRSNTEGMDVTYGQAIKINDYLTLGITTMGNTAIEANIVGQMPAATKYDLNLYNVNDYQGTGMYIDSNGILTVSREGFSYTTASSLWGGFLTQNATAAVTAYSEMINNISINSEIVFSAASKTGPISWGVNIIPISATAAVNNVVQTLITTDYGDAYFYSPNVDISDEAAVANWVSNPDLYGASGGYNQSVVDIPQGEIVADTKYAGTYAGSALRIDLGATYDLGDSMTISLMAENLNNSGLNMTGTGLTAYGTHRYNTAESPTVDPITGVTWNPFTDYEQVIPETADWALPSEQYYPLPRRLRAGVAWKKPIIFSIDYEMQLNPMEVVYKHSDGNYAATRISNINILRLGIESSILSSPVKLRGSTGLLLKPTVENDPDLAASVNSVYSTLPVLPAMLNLGGEINFWGTKAGLGFGYNGLTLLSLVQLDTVSTNISQLLYWSIYADNDQWNLTFSQAVDPTSTASAYLAAHPGSSVDFSSFQFSDLKWLSTIAIGYEF